MIIKIEKGNESAILEYACAVFDLDCRIFTMENNPNLVQAEILRFDGEEIDPVDAWLLCKSVAAKLERVETTKPL